MEKIIIKEISDELRTKAKNVPFWGVKLADGREATIWDVSIAEAVKANLNVESEAEIRGQGTFLNVRAFNGGETTMTSENPVVKQIDKIVHSDKDKSIVAQCLTKICFRNKNVEHMDDVLNTYNHFVEKL